MDRDILVEMRATRDALVDIKQELVNLNATQKTHIAAGLKDLCDAIKILSDYLDK
jgi:hypothetical protein